MPFGVGVQTPKISTGNVRTTFDPVTTSISAVGGYLPTPTFGVFGLANPLGTIFQDQGGPDGCSGTATQLPVGTAAIYKYVLYKSTTNPALVTGPAIVYYTNAAMTQVSGTLADGVTATSADVAGLLMPNTTDVSTLTAAILNNGGNGSGVWICINGFVKAANAPGSTAVGDFLIGASGNFTLARIAAHSGTYTPDRLVATAMSAVASNLADMLVQISLDV